MPNMCVFNSAGGRACVCVDFANRKRVCRHGALDLRAVKSVPVLETSGTAQPWFLQKTMANKRSFPRILAASVTLQRNTLSRTICKRHDTLWKTCNMRWSSYRRGFSALLFFFRTLLGTESEMASVHLQLNSCCFIKS